MTQYYLASDVESNSSPSQVCTMLAHVNIGAGVHVHNTPPTYIHKQQHQVTTRNDEPNKTYKNIHILQVNIYGMSNKNTKSLDN